MRGTYLITGGGGNLTCQLTFELVKRGCRVVLLDVVEKPNNPTAEGCIYVRGDMRSREDLADVLKNYRPQVILHFASLLSGSSDQDRELAWRVNVDGAFNLFELALEYDVDQVFFPSSLASFGGRLPDPLPEDFPQWPVGMYGVTKVAVERLGVYYHEKHGLDFRCLRLPVVLSAFASPGAVSSYASNAFIEAVRCGRFTFKVRPETQPSIIYVKDVLDGVIGLLNTPVGKLTRRVYNMHAMAPQAKQIAQVIAARIPDVELIFDPDPKVVDLIESWPIQITDSSARKDWGWRPKYDLERTADDFIQELRVAP